MKRLPTLALVAASLLIVLASTAMRPPQPTAGPVPVAGATEKAVFSGGCFWGLQAAFDELPGVVATRVGYTGGATSSPTYGQVAAGKSGHAEAIEVTFDPERISFEDLARYFFAHHKAHNDEPEATYRTRAYRSSIFVQTGAQRAIASRVLAEIVARNTDRRPIATLIESATTFWQAEAEHQKYLARCAH